MNLAFLGAVVKKYISPGIVLLCVFTACSSNDMIDRFEEGGVETILNHTEPYKLQNQSSTFTLSEDFSIDTESDEYTALGLIEIWGFDIDSHGNLFIFTPPGRSENHIFKFSKRGEYISTFARRGQGPGELQYPSYQRINHLDEIPVVDMRGSKLVIFGGSGEIINEFKLDQQFCQPGFIRSLSNGNYLVVRRQPDISNEFGYLILSIFNSQFEEIKELDRFKNFYPQNAPRYKFPPDMFKWDVAPNGDIYVGNTERGYEILIFDSTGNLTRKIIKEFTRLDVPEELKQQVFATLPEDHPYRKKIYFADFMPPFEHLFLDDEGRLFVKTTEIDLIHNQYIYDIYTADGIFIGQIPIEIASSPFANMVAIQDNRLYCVQEKPSGYKKLVIYRMDWD